MQQSGTKRLENHGRVWINGDVSKKREPWESKNYIFIHGLCKACKGPLQVSTQSLNKVDTSVSLSRTTKLDKSRQIKKPTKA